MREFQVTQTVAANSNDSVDTFLKYSVSNPMFQDYRIRFAAQEPEINQVQIQSHKHDSYNREVYIISDCGVVGVQRKASKHAKDHTN